MFAATAVHSDAVSGGARCGCPFDRNRAVRSIWPPRSARRQGGRVHRRRHEADDRDRGDGSCLGVVARDAHGDGGLAPDRLAAGHRAGSRSRSSGSSRPGHPQVRARTNTHALAASIMEHFDQADAGHVQPIRRGCPGTRPVVAPPGARKSSRTGAPVPASRGSQVAIGRRAAVLSGNVERSRLLLRVGVENTRHGSVAVRSHDTFVHGERPDRRTHVAAVTAVVHARIADLHLAKV